MSALQRRAQTRSQTSAAPLLSPLSSGCCWLSFSASNPSFSFKAHITNHSSVHFFKAKSWSTGASINDFFRRLLPSNILHKRWAACFGLQEWLLSALSVYLSVFQSPHPTPSTVFSNACNLHPIIRPRFYFPDSHLCICYIVGSYL